MSQPSARRKRRSATVDFDARDQDEVGGAGSASPGSTTTTRTPGSRRSGSRSSKLAMRGSAGTAMVKRPVAFGRRSARSSPSSAGSRCGIGEPRHDAEARPAGARLDGAQALGEERRIAAQLVDQEAPDAPPVGRRQHRARADEAGDDAAAVDVADEHHRHVRGFGEAHVGDVAGPEIDLGRAAGALDDDDVGVAADDGEALQHLRQQVGLAPAEVGGARASRRAAPGR